MSRVMVTGASGFIGRHLLPACLRAGHEVHAVSSRPAAGDSAMSTSQEDIRWHQADLLDPGAVSSLIARVRPELLVHLAWYAEHGRFWASPENVRWVESSLALMRAFAAAGGRRAVMAGTCAEYDWAAIEPVRPDQPLPRCHELRTPNGSETLYGTCKRAANLVAERFAVTADLELAYGRVFFLYGPDEQPGRLVAQVTRSLLAGERVATSDGRQIRDFLHVADVAEAFAAILESDVLGAVNVASGEPVTVRDVIESIAMHVGRSELLDWGARPRAKDDPEVLLADIGRLREEVGFTARIGLADGLGTTVEWWRRQLHAQSTHLARG
jgi:nucleoside-diphosphate-sugar epimerase